MIFKIKSLSLSVCEMSPAGSGNLPQKFIRSRSGKFYKTSWQKPELASIGAYLCLLWRLAECSGVLTNLGGGHIGTNTRLIGHFWYGCLTFENTCRLIWAAGNSRLRM